MSLVSKENSPEEIPIQQGVQARILTMDSTVLANPFVMQMDYLASATLKKTVRLDLSIGPNLIGDRFFSTPSGADSIVIRRALGSTKLNEESSIEVGRDIPVAGLNFDDHTALIRSRNKLGVLDYPTQIRLIHQTESLQFLPYVYGPSFEESSQNREYGLGTRTEYLLNMSNSVGITTLFGNSPSFVRKSMSGYIRLSQADRKSVV
jgi:hypothetical protein